LFRPYTNTSNTTVAPATIFCVNNEAYSRNYSLFNPTVYQNNSAIKNYNFTKWTSLLPSQLLIDTKYKFYSWGSNIVSTNMLFYEFNMGDNTQNNAIFYGAYVAFTSVQVYSCQFYLITPYIQNQLGWN